MKVGNKEIINTSAFNLKNAVDETRKLIKESTSTFDIHLIIEDDPSIGYNEEICKLSFMLYKMAVINNDQDLFKRIKEKEIDGKGFLITIEHS